MDKVSIIIPVFNTAKHLRCCLDSILHQTLYNIEIACINDGSTDNSLEILQEYAIKDNRIKVISQENKGQAAARNRALSEITGTYTFFADADDYIHPQTLEILLNIAKKTNCPVVATERTKTYDGNRLYDTENLHYKIHQKPLEHILATNIASSSVIWNKLYKTELIKHRPFIEGIYFEDWPWVTCLFADIDKYASVPYALYAYNTTNESTMRSRFTLRKINDYVTGIKAVQAFFAKPEYTSSRQIVRSKRISASVKMMINKTYHEKSGQPDLDKYLLKQLRYLKELQSFCYRDLPIKVLLRIFKIWGRNVLK